MVKNILLGLILTTLAVQSGFKTKTQLQRLSESYVNFEPPKVNKKKKDEVIDEIEEKSKGKQDGEPQQKLLTSIKDEITNLFNYSNRKSSKSKKDANNYIKNSKREINMNKITFTPNLTINIPHLSFSRFFS